MSVRPRIVLDTNILIASIGRSSPLRWIFDALLDERFVLCLSQQVLFEYETVLARKTTTATAQNVVRMLVVLPNTHHIEPHYRWKLIVDDSDDDKFVDLAVAAGAYALVTHDRHFDVLRKVDFPPLRVMSANQFRDLLN